MERVLSGIQPTGQLHIGNYLGALKQWVALQQNYECYYCVVDLHALTVRQDPKTFAQKTLGTAMDLLALGVDPAKAPIFVQSQMPEHTELMWILNTITPFGELRRMTQWKEKDFRNHLMRDPHFIALTEEVAKGAKSRAVLGALKNEHKDDQTLLQEEYESQKDSNKHAITKKASILEFELKQTDSANVGLLNYPILMAADILLYKSAFVPVGEDQVQHVELTRVLARKFNKLFGETFPEPKPKLTKAARIMSLTEPTKKMSKSHGEKSYIALTDEPDVIRQKLNKAVTATSGGKKTDPGVANLFAIMNEVSSKQTVGRFEEQQKDGSIKYSELKKQLADDLAKHLAEFRSRRKELAKKESYIREVLEDGQNKAAKIAGQTMEEVRQKIGLLRP